MKVLGLVQGLIPHFLFSGTWRHGRFYILLTQASSPSQNSCQKTRKSLERSNKDNRRSAKTSTEARTTGDIAVEREQF